MASRLARFSWLPGGIAAAAVIAIGKFVSPSPLSPLELGIYDRAQRNADVPATQEFVLVDIDKRSFDALGPWPWPHNIHADLIQELTQAQARVIAFTTPLGAVQPGGDAERLRAALSLLEASNLGNSEQALQLRELLKASGNVADPEGQLAAAIAAHGHVVVPVSVRMGEDLNGSVGLPAHFFATHSTPALRAAMPARVGEVLPTRLNQAAAAGGHLHLAEDRDGVLRTDISAVRVENGLLPSLATAVAVVAMSSDPAQLAFVSDGAATLDARKFDFDGALLSRPQYIHDTARLARFTYQQILHGEVPASLLRDKIVLIGLANEDSALTIPGGANSSMNVVTASAVASLLHGESYSHPKSAVISEWAIAAGVILFAAFLLPAAGLALGALAAALLSAILVITEVGLLGSTHLWVQLLTPAFAIVAGYVLYALGEMVRLANTRSSASKDPTANLRALGQTFQRQGQLDLAFETYRRCPLDAPTMELLYFLGMDFERRRQNQKAAAVYSHIASRDPNYRDLRARRARVAEDRPVPQAPVDKPKTRPLPVAKVEDWSQDPFGEQRPPSLGRKLGRYELERELGKGAMGVVYLGRDPNINRVVAIKAIPLADEFEEQDLEEARARFFREAEMAGRLNHPAIVTVYDAGEDEGLAYIAMEYLRGHHLSAHTDASNLLPPQTVMTLVARTAEALHYAHRQNVVHRDIKPANIMFNAETDELKITDFGIARLTDSSRTKTGIVLGTPSFMSPEQLEGRSLDGRSDQFALGISLYQLLTGQLPFRAESMPRLMQKIATEPHTPIRLIRPELPEAVEAIINRTLAKSADERYANCGEMAADLRACAQALEPAKKASEHEWLLP